MGNRGERSDTGERLFVSLDPSDEVRQVLAAWGRDAAAGFRGARPVGPDSIHLTLAFLGNRSASERDAVLASLEEVDSGGADLGTSGPVLLPHRRPKALAIGVSDPEGNLEALRSEVLGLLADAIGWRPERRGFLPHMTVVRIGRDAAGPGGTALPPTPAIGFRASDLVLYRSRLEPSGAIYEALGRLDLDGAAE